VKGSTLKCLNVKLTTKKYAGEISWSFGTCLSNGPYEINNFYEQECCLGAGTYTVTCKDSYGDGWNGGYLEIAGKTLCGGNFGKLKERTLTI